jgi:hypothetical protein
MLIRAITNSASPLTMKKKQCSLCCLGFSITPRGRSGSRMRELHIKNVYTQAWNLNCWAIWYHPGGLTRTQRRWKPSKNYSRFISKLGERGLPFYRLLRKVDGFQWDDQAALAFVELKQYLKSLPTLEPPNLMTYCYYMWQLSTLWSAQ